MPVQLTLLCGMPQSFRIAQGWGPNPSPGCLHFIILVALLYFQRFPQSIPCVKKSQFGLAYLSLTQGVTGVLLSPRSFFSPGSGGEGAIFQYPHCLSHLSLPPICSTLCMLSFPCGYQLQGWCCPPGFLCVNRALDVILSTLPPCTPLWYQYCLFFRKYVATNPSSMLSFLLTFPVSFPASSLLNQISHAGHSIRQHLPIPHALTSF